MLMAIRSFIQEHQLVTEQQLVLHFKVDPGVLTPMLDLLLQRHEIVVVSPDLCQEQCQDCDNPVYYQWIFTR